MKKDIMTQLFELQCKIVADIDLRPDLRIRAVIKIERAIMAMIRAETQAHRMLDELPENIKGDSL
jgi:hypothetical protein